MQNGHMLEYSGTIICDNYFTFSSLDLLSAHGHRAVFETYHFVHSLGSKRSPDSITDSFCSCNIAETDFDWLLLVLKSPHGGRRRGYRIRDCCHCEGGF